MYEIKFLEFNKNPLIEFENYPAKNIYQMFHLTNLQNAKRILSEGFNPNLAKTGAFGLGINLSTTIEDLEIYSNNKNNILLTCLVKYNKKRENFSNVTNKNFFQKHGYTKPKFIKPPEGYDALFSENIYVIPHKEQVYPMMMSKINFY